MSLEETKIDEDTPHEFTQARFSIDLNLPSADSQWFEDAKKAIRREYRDSAKWKQLRCRKVSVVSEAESGTVYELEIGHAVEFDWTWEGSVAFRPLRLKEFEESQATFFKNGSLDPEIEDSIVWSGEVLEVDEATGRIFIVVANPEHPPHTMDRSMSDHSSFSHSWMPFTTNLRSQRYGACSRLGWQLQRAEFILM